MEGADGELVTTHVWATGNVTLGCYPGAIGGRDRFLITACIVLLPFVLYFFELLRFRVLSRFIEKRRKKKSSGVGTVIFDLTLKPLGNLFLWLTWPLVAFFRQFWSRFRYETVEGADSSSSVLPRRRRARRDALISARAQLIEVCTEASLQPLFQFYLVFQEIIRLDEIANDITVREGFSFAISTNTRQVGNDAPFFNLRNIKYDTNTMSS